jgi:hypothetical protein
MDFKFDLGEVLKDKVTGFEGVVLGRSDYFTGCNHYGLCSRKLDSNGKTIDWEWFDETRMVPVRRAKKLVAEPSNNEGSDAKAVGGPVSSPPSM